jgi:acetoin utilization protein AcuC
MQQASSAFIHSGEIEKYHYPPESPFKTERAAQTKSILASMGLHTVDGCVETAPRPASADELLLFHEERYISALRRVSSGDIRPDDLFLGLGSQDCPVFNDLFAYAALASGGTIVAAELILGGKARFAFNPSGGYHHALAAAAGGFCYINDVVLGCKVLENKGKKVFCLDLDAHHGNGTQAAFYGDPRVFTVSFHESGKTLFPWGGFANEIGEADGYGYNVNVPLPAGTDDETFTFAYKSIVPPLLSAFRPDVIVLEAGMDVLSVDPLTHLSMTNNAIADAVPLLRDSGVPVLMVGGGGYNPEHTARGWALVWSVLRGCEPDAGMSIGMGGVFLGNAEWGAGLRDGRVYATGDDKASIRRVVEEAVQTVHNTVFPIHCL